MAFGLAAGVALTVLGMYLAPKILVLMGTPSDVLPQSVEYFRTYFAGSLGLSCITFSSASCSPLATAVTR